MVARHRNKRYGRRAGSFRQCAGCKRRLARKHSLRLVGAAEGGLLPDLFDKLPGRGVHLCPNVACFERALAQRPLSRLLQVSVSDSQPQKLCEAFLQASRHQVKSLLAVSVRSGWMHAGRSNVREVLRSRRVALVLVAENASISLKREMLKRAVDLEIPVQVVLTTSELSAFHRGRPLAVVGIGHRGIAQRLCEEITKMSGLTESMQAWKLRKQRQLTGKPVRGKMPTQHTGPANGR